MFGIDSLYRLNEQIFPKLEFTDSWVYTGFHFTQDSA